MIRGIIFDCFGVLYHGSIGHLQDLTPAANRAALANLSLSSDYGYVSQDEFILEASQLAGRTIAEIEAIMQADHIRNTALVAYVRTLRPSYKVGLLSNVGRGVIDRLFTADELAELFDAVVLSSEVGMVKPDPDIYRLTAQWLGIAPEDCLMVDDLAANINGAQSIGMQGLVFTNTQQFISDVSIRFVGR